MATDEGRTPSCPTHGIRDCSPLLNGCSWRPEPGRTLSWAANWYKTRRHVIGEDGRALCHATTQTSVFPDGWQSDTYSVPAGDSPEVMALQPCGLCMRKVKR